MEIVENEYRRSIVVATKAGKETQRNKTILVTRRLLRREAALVYVWVARFPVWERVFLKGVTTNGKNKTRRESRQITWKILMKHRLARRETIPTEFLHSKRKEKGKWRKKNKDTLRDIE